MNVLDFIRLVLKNSKILAGSTLVFIVIAFVSSMNEPKKYSSHTLLNTGLISGYNIESQKSGRVDYAFTNNEMENLINVATATETTIELSIRLLITTLQQYKLNQLEIENSNLFIIEELANQFNKIITIEEPVDSLYEQLHQSFLYNRESSIYALLHSKHPFFSLKQLEDIVVSREGNSDMIRMEYTVSDPRMCQLTLDMLTSIFLKKHGDIKQGQTNSVIDFFEEATRNTSSKLNDAENKLLQFSVRNQIINYYEQTRFISGNKQELEKQYQNKLKTLAGADSVIRTIELELQNQSAIPFLRSSIAIEKSKISGVASELALIEITENNDDQEILNRKYELEKKLDSMRQTITSSASTLMEINVTPDGVHTKELLVQWLKNVIIKEESKAQIEVMNQRKTEYKEIYRRFAPLGSTLKRLEREIDVAEREYLENLHSYNQARLHKFNMMMSSNLKVIDAPFYPASPEKSKRILFLMISMIVGFVLPLSLIIAFELLNDSLKNPARAKKTIKLPVVGTIPQLPKNNKHGIRYDLIIPQAMNLFFQQIRTQSVGSKKPFSISLFSTELAEGKSFMLKEIKKYAEKLNINVLTITPFSKGNTDTEDTIYYNAADEQFFSIENIEQLIDKKRELKHYDFVFMEMPSIIHHTYHPNLIKTFDMNVMVCAATRTWTQSDKHALKIYKSVAASTPQILLNGVSIDVMEQVIGQIPKQRTKIRKWIKGLFVRVGDATYTQPEMVCHSIDQAEKSEST